MKRAASISLGVLLGIIATPGLAKKAHAPLPQKILTAKTIYIENRAGSAKFADKAYDELKKWGRFEIVTEREKADLVFLLTSSGGETSQGKTQVYDPSANNGYGGWKYGTVHSSTTGHTQLAILDPETGEALYGDEKPWGNLFSGSATRNIIKELRKRMEEQEQKSKKK